MIVIESAAEAKLAAGNPSIDSRRIWWQGQPMDCRVAFGSSQ